MSNNQSSPSTKKIILWSFLFIVGFIVVNLVAIPQIFWGKSITALLKENSIRSELSNRINKLTNLKIPQDIKIMLIFEEEGNKQIFLEVTPQQSQELIQQIELQKKWQKINRPFKFMPCSLQPFSFANSQKKTTGKTTYYEIKTTQENYQFEAKFCPENNQLMIEETFL